MSGDEDVGKEEKKRGTGKQRVWGVGDVGNVTSIVELAEVRKDSPKSKSIVELFPISLMHSCATRNCPTKWQPGVQRKEKDKRRSRREDTNDHIDDAKLVNEVVLIGEVVNHYRENEQV